MSLGQGIRKLLGPAFPMLGRLYRSIFIDLDIVVDCFPSLERTARILDIGGGDGEVLNRILDRHGDVSVTMIDIADSIGTSLRPEFRNRVELLPATSIAAYRAKGRPHPECIMLSCVLHHIPSEDRAVFLGQLRDLIGVRPVTLIVLDVEPGHIRSRLGLLSDRYITGDRQTSLVSRAEVVEMMKRFFPGIRWSETDLYKRDKPNYCLVFALEGSL